MIIKFILEEEMKWLSLKHISPLSRRTSPSWHIPSKLHAFQRCHSVDKTTRRSQSGWTKIINWIYWLLKDVFVHCMKCLHGNKHRPEPYYPVPADPTSIFFFLKIEIYMYFENKNHVQVKNYSISLQDGLIFPQTLCRCSNTLMPICKSSPLLSSQIK